MSIPVLVVSVICLALQVYLLILQKVLPKPPRTSTDPSLQSPPPMQSATDASLGWFVLVPLGVCSLVNLIVTAVLNYLKGLLWPFSEVLRSVLLDIPWFYGFCIVTVFPVFIMYERYRGPKIGRLLQALIVWPAASAGYSKIITTFYELEDSQDIQMATSTAGGFVAGILYWFIMRYLHRAASAQS